LYSLLLLVSVQHTLEVPSTELLLLLLRRRRQQRLLLPPNTRHPPVG
jgi:hypothetical protein